MQKSARAAVFHGHVGQLTLETLPIPELAPDQALVRVLACTICGSDLHSLHGRRAVATPTILGHEICGQLVALGSKFPTNDLNGQQLKPGDTLSWAIVANCDNCRHCLAGLPQKCEIGVKYGHMGWASGQILSGGLAEYCVLAAGTKVIRLPSNLDLAVACPASCATATICAALEAAAKPAATKRKIAILGLGMLGLTACAIAADQGYKEIVGVDPQPSRRELAKSFAATKVLSPQEFTEICASPATQQHDRFETVLELSGQSEMVAAGGACLDIGGKLILVGSVFPVPPVEFFPEQIVRKNLTIAGVHNYAPRHLAQAIDILDRLQGKYPFASLVERWVSLAELPTLIQAGPHFAGIRLGVRP
ncbi:MAG: zinc-binding dehydrogenase [Pirellulales bacterium]|nr:zinc-binding dehydrogenase [Pirellulales bacterium]